MYLVNDICHFCAISFRICEQFYTLVVLYCSTLKKFAYKKYSASQHERECKQHCISFYSVVLVDLIF